MAAPAASKAASHGSGENSEGASSGAADETGPALNGAVAAAGVWGIGFASVGLWAIRSIWAVPCG